MALDIKTNLNLNINKSEILSISNKKSRIDAKLLRKIKIFFSCKWCNRKFDNELSNLKKRKINNEAKLKEVKQKMDKFDTFSEEINEKRNLLIQKANKLIENLEKSKKLQDSILSDISFSYYTMYDFDWKKIRFNKENFTNLKPYICKRHKISKIENTIGRLLIKSNNINKILQIFKSK